MTGTDNDYTPPWWRAQRRTVAAGWYNDCAGSVSDWVPEDYLGSPLDYDPTWDDCEGGVGA